MGYSPWGCKESDTTERLHFISLHFRVFKPYSLTVAFVPISKTGKLRSEGRSQMSLDF